MVVPPLAGSAGMSYRRFLVFDAAGSLLYSSCGLLLGIFFSAHLIQCMAVLRRFGVGASASALALTLDYIAFKLMKSKRSGSEPRLSHLSRTN